jgi:hypothetical protein
MHSTPHTVVPPAHSSAHDPLEQTSPGPHGWLQPPQCAGSTSVSTHVVVQKVVPPPQMTLHSPAEQNSPGAHG